jgi:thiol:disulfide interchange protein DsbD
VIALPLAFGAGIATSLGPCIAPRYLALAAIIGSRRPLLPIVTFAAGVVLGTIVLGSGAAAIALVVAHTAVIDAIVAVGLIACGIVTLVREPDACRHDPHHAHAHISGAFALGVASTLVISPCCGPIIAAVAASGAADGDPRTTAAALAAFALGHVAPIVPIGLLGTTFARPLTHLRATAAPAVISGALTIALGCYYGVLA